MTDNWKYDKYSVLEHCTYCHNWNEWGLAAGQKLTSMIGKQNLHHCIKCGARGYLVLRNREEHYPHIVYLEQTWEQRDEQRLENPMGIEK